MGQNPNYILSLKWGPKIQSLLVKISSLTWVNGALPPWHLWGARRSVPSSRHPLCVNGQGDNTDPKCREPAWRRKLTSKPWRPKTWFIAATHPKFSPREKSQHTTKHVEALCHRFQGALCFVAGYVEGGDTRQNENMPLSNTALARLNWPGHLGSED